MVRTLSRFRPLGAPPTRPSPRRPHPAGATSLVNVGSTATVRGVVRRFSWTDLRRDYAWFDLRPGFDEIFRARPVIVATSVLGPDGTERVGRAKQPPLERMARHPGDFYGSFVSVRAQVGEVESPHVFTLDEGTGQPDALVLIADPARAATLSEAAQVTVKGVVRPFFAPDLVRDYDWFELDRDLAEQLEGRAVIVAESVRNAAGREFVEAEPKNGRPLRDAHRPTAAP